MSCCDGFFMGNSLSDPKDLLIPFIGTNPTNEPISSGLQVARKEFQRLSGGRLSAREDFEPRFSMTRHAMCSVYQQNLNGAGVCCD
jgi:hypothetical protein